MREWGRGSVIDSVYPCAERNDTAGFYVYDARGGVVTPGFIDAHAHWSGTRRYYVRAPPPPLSQRETTGACCGLAAPFRSTHVPACSLPGAT
jgi:formylmethanofuran dehydrogenase subunit A